MWNLGLFVYFWISVLAGLCLIMAGTGLLLTREHWMHRLTDRAPALDLATRRRSWRLLTGWGASLVAAGAIVVAQALYTLFW